MSEEQGTSSWRSRLFGSNQQAEAVHADADAPQPRGDGDSQAAGEHVAADDSATEATASEAAAPEADAPAEHAEAAPGAEPAGQRAWQARHDDPEAAGPATAEYRPQGTGEVDIEPLVVAPSELRGPSHDSVPAPEPQAATPGEPPALVEPERPQFGLRRRDRIAEEPVDAAGHEEAAAPAGTASESHIEPEATTAQAPVVPSAEPAADTQAATQVAPIVPVAMATNETAQFEVAEPTATGTIDVDEETARAAATGTPIVLVETPVPPKKKGARGVGFLVVVLSTIVFAALALAAVIVSDYLLNRDFAFGAVLSETALSPAFILPVIVFFAAYLLLSLIVNRAGWWAHVLGGFVVAALTYFAFAYGMLMQEAGGWSQFAAPLGAGVVEMIRSGAFTLPMAFVIFVFAREVPIWLGGIVAKRGRTLKRRHQAAMEEFETENAEKIAAYERARA